MSLNFDIWKALGEMSLNDSLDFLKTFAISNDQLKYFCCILFNSFCPFKIFRRAEIIRAIERFF